MPSLRRTFSQRVESTQLLVRTLPERLRQLRIAHPELEDVRASDPRIRALLEELHELEAPSEIEAPRARLIDLGLGELDLDVASLGGLSEALASELGLGATGDGAAPSPPAGAEAASGALYALGNALGLMRSKDDELDWFFKHWSSKLNFAGGDSEPDHALIVAEETRKLVDEIIAELGVSINRSELQVELDAELGDLLGESAPGIVRLAPGFDPFSRQGRGLLTHELVHEAQRHVRTPITFSVEAAEAEAETIMHEVMAGGVARAPEVGLPFDEEAGCGPQAMAEKAEEEELEKECEGPKCKKCKGKGCDEKDPEPCIGKDCPPPPPPGGGEKDCVGDNCFSDGRQVEDGEGGMTPDVPLPPVFDIPVDTNDCAEPCPDPIAENKLPPSPKTPPPAPKGEGEARTLTIAGHKINFRLPKTAKAGRVTVRFRQSDSPLAALQLKSAVITIGDDLKIRSGQLHCAVRLGKFVQVPNAVMSIGSNGAVTARIHNAKVKVGIASGTLDLNITRDGIQGNGTFKFNQFQIANGVKFTGGVAQVAVDAGGSISAHGTFDVQIGEHLKAQLELCFVDGELRGALTAELVNVRIPVVPKLVHVTRVKLGGCWSKTGISLHGEVDTDVRGWLKGELSADYKKPHGGSADWSLAGKLSLAQPFTLANTLTVSAASLSGKYAGGKLEPLEGEVDLHTENLTGKLKGTLDVDSGKLNGTAAVDVTVPIEAGPFSVEQGHLEATIADNELTEIFGSMKVALAMEGQPTFEVDCERAVYVVKSKELHANGSLNVLRDVVIGSPDTLHATIPMGYAGGFAVESGALVNAGARITVNVAHGGNPIGVGSVGFGYSEAEGLSGDLDFSLVGRTGIPSYEAGPLYLLPGGVFKCAVERSSLKEASAADVQWELAHPAGTGKVCGQVSGSYDFGSGKASLSGMAWVQEPWVITLGAIGSLTFKQGGEGSVKVTDQGVEALTAKALGFDLAVTSGALGAFTIQGEASGALDPKEGSFDGSFKASLAEGSALHLPALGPIEIVVQGGSKVDGTIGKEGLVGPLTGELDIDVLEDGLEFLDGKLGSAQLDVDKGQVSGDGQLGLAVEKSLADLGVILPAGVTGRLLPGTGISATIVGNTITTLGGSVLSMFALGGEDVAQGNLQLQWDLASGAITGDIYGNLLGDIELTTPSGQEQMTGFGVTLIGGSQIALKLGVQGLEQCDVDVTAHLTHGKDPVAAANVRGQWLFGETGKLTGDATISLLKDIPVTSTGRFQVVIGQETTATALVADSKLVSGSATFVLGLDESGKRMASLELEADIGKAISGAAKLTVHENIQLGLGTLGQTQFGVDISTETGGEVVLEDNQPTSTQGTLALEVTGNGVPFARGQFTVDADLAAADSPVTAEGDVSVIQSFVVGASTDFELSLEQGTAARANIVDSALADLDGQLCLGLKHQTAGPVGTMTIGGHYRGGQKPIVNGKAAVALTKGFQVFEAGAYGFGFAPSTFSASVVNSDIAGVSGSFGMWAEQRGGDDKAPLGTVEVQMDGSFARVPGANVGTVSGKGSLNVTGDFKVAQAGAFELVVSAGTNANVEVAANEFVKVSGGIVGRVDQNDQVDKQLLSLEGTVDYIPKDGGKVDATGKVRMLGRRFITSTAGGYSIWLAPGVSPTGADIEIEQNDIKSLSGSIGCEIHDDAGPLLHATVRGAWDAESDITGEASVELAPGRALTFPKDATGARIEVTEARAEALVQNSELQSFGGGVTAVVYDGDGALVGLTGTGEVDATTGTLVHATAGVTLFRPIKIPLGGKPDAVVIDDMSATATIENNELTEAEGKISIKLPHLGDGGMSVVITGGWRRGKDGEKDAYWGRGTLEFTAIDDPDTGRKLHGSVSVDVQENGKWNVDGQLDWSANHDVGGKVGVTMDDQLDPVIEGSVSVQPFEIVAGRELFSKHFNLLPPITIGAPPVSARIGATLGFGMSLKPLTMSVDPLAVRNWRPFSKSGSTLPDFEAGATVAGGMDFWLEVAPYLAVVLGIPGLLNVQLGVEAGLRLDVPIAVTAAAKLFGGPQGFSGYMDLAISIKPLLSLLLRPYISGEVLFFDLGKAKLAEIGFDLGSPFGFDWGGRYNFGDAPPTTARGAAAKTQAAGSPKETDKKQKNIMPPLFPNKSSEAAPKPGRPKVGEDGQGDGAGAGMGGADGQLGKILAIAESMGELGTAIGAYQDAPDPIMTPASIEIAYTLKRAAWIRVAMAGRRLVDLAKELMPSLEYDLPIWVKLIIDNPFNPPSPGEAWASEDDWARGKVYDATYLAKLPPEGLMQLGNAMIRGSCGDADEFGIYLLLTHAKERGCLKQIVDGLGGFETVNDNINGSERQLFRKLYADLGHDVDD